MQKLRASAGLHILDDFLFVAPSAKKREADLVNFLRLCYYLGVTIAVEKTVEPRTTLEFAGITLDSVSLTSNSYPSGASVPYRSFKLCVFCRCARPRFPTTPY